MSAHTTPELEERCGSWVIVDRAGGKPVLETFSKSVASAVNQDKYEVLTAAQWFGRFNGSLRKWS